MSSAESALQEPAADPTAPRLRSRPTVADGHRTDFNAIARWLRRALAESARAWALAAGVPPDLYN